MRITATVEIAAAAPHVFACIDEPEKIVGWVEGATEHRYTSERSGSAIGQTFHQVILQGGKPKAFDGTITDFHPPNRFGFHIPSPAYSSQVLFRLAALTPAAPPSCWRCATRRCCC